MLGYVLVKLLSFQMQHGTETPVLVKKSKGNPETVESVRLFSPDNDPVEVQWKVEEVSLANFILTRTECHIPVSFQYAGNGK